MIHCETLLAAGRDEDAKTALRAAVAAIESRASKIKIERWRATFLATRDNVRTFELAKKLL